MYETAQLAEDVLIELWTKNDYRQHQGPVNIYRCDDCGYFHLTSLGEMNANLARYLSSDKVRINKAASKWMDKFKNKF